MGCSSSRSQENQVSHQTQDDHLASTSTGAFSSVEDDTWMFYAPRSQKQSYICFSCGQMCYYDTVGDSDRSPFHTPDTTPTQLSSATFSSVSSTHAFELEQGTRPPDSAAYTNRTYSFLSTPTFHSPSSHPRNGLTLDPTLFSSNISPFVELRRVSKIDTDCASQFSSPLASTMTPDFQSPTSSLQRYPLPPMSVLTEPFPRHER